MQWATIKGSVTSLMQTVKSLGEECAALKRAAVLADDDNMRIAVTSAGNSRQRTQFAPSLATTSSDVVTPRSPSFRGASGDASPSRVDTSGGSLPSLDRRTMARAGSSRRMFDANQTVSALHLMDLILLLNLS